MNPLKIHVMITPKNTQQHSKADERHPSSSKSNAQELVDPISQSIAELHTHMESKIGRHQRTIEAVTANLGRPRFLYIILLFVLAWIFVNLLLARLHISTFDPPPFYWLQGIVGLSALLMTTVVLITQNRQNKMTEQRRRLDLQVNLVVEQKVTKLIELMEELRRDIPSVKNRHDPEVEALKEPVDPHEVLFALNDLMDENSQEWE
jgi:uncharacterized membrane protein